MSHSTDEDSAFKLSLREDGGPMGAPQSETSSRIDPALSGIDTMMSTMLTMSPSITDARQRAVMIEDVPFKYYASLMDRLENKKKGGGRILHNERVPSDPEKIVVVFAHSKVAENMLRLQRLEIVGETFNIRRLPDNYRLSSYLDQSLSSSEKMFVEVLDTIKVFNVPADLSEENLELYFENPRRANGGPTKSIHLIPEKRQAIIQYIESKDALAVASKKIHSFSTYTMPVVLMEPELKLCCHAIQVSGIDWGKINEDFLTMYFEAPNRSGGGQVVETIADKEHGRAVITFTSGQVAENVLEKGRISGHQLGKIPLHVEIMKPRPTAPAFVGDVEQHRLIVKGLPLRTSLSKLSEFVEKVSGCGVIGWALGLDPSTVMLEFDGDPDYKALRRQVHCIPFMGHMINIQKMPLSTFVQISDLSPTETVNSILDYFKDQTSADHAICYEQKSKTSIILQFHSNAAAKGILSGQHVLNGQRLNLKLYSKELECVLPVWASIDPTDNCTRMLRIKCTEPQLCCIQKNSSVQKEIEKKLKVGHCVITWPSAPGDFDVQLDLDKDSKNEDQLWPDKCLNLLQTCLDDLFCEAFITTAEVWAKLKERIKDDHSQLACEFDDERNGVFVYGFTNDVKDYMRRIEEMEDLIKKQLEEERNRKLETLTSLKPHQRQYIQVAGIVDEVKSRLSSMTIEADDQAVSLFGKEEDLSDAKLAIYASLSNVDSKFIDLTESLTELITTEPTAGFIKEYFAQNRVKVIVQGSQERLGITIYGIEDELKKAEEFLNSQFVEDRIEMNDAARQATQSKEWCRFVNSLNRFVIIRLEIDVCILACKKDLFDEVKHKLIEIFDKYSAVECFVSMKLSHVELFSMQAELQKLDKKLKESAFEGVLKKVLTTSGTSGFGIKGQHEEVESVRKQLEAFATRVIERQHEINHPGIITLMQSVEGEEHVKSLQGKHSVVLKMDLDTKTTGITSPNFRPVIRHRTEIAEGHEIVIELRDILDISTNAIINPTTPNIELSRGFGLEIVRLGGKEIEQKCKDHIKTCRVLLPGNIFVSSTEKLVCDAVIHVAEPDVFDNLAVSVYRAAVESVLTEAARRNFDSVAFPLHFGITFKRQLLFLIIKEFFEKNDTGSLKKIHFCDSNEELLEDFEKQLKNYESSSSAAAASGGASSPNMASSPQAAIQYCLTTPEGILVKFFKGTICDLPVDAIVNSTAKNLTLGNGGISKAILLAAGPEIEKECLAKRPGGFSQFGEVLKTSPYKLSRCKAVYHGAAVQWDSSNSDPCIKVLRAFVSQALLQADKDGMTSIAIPAIGSGTLKVPHDTVTDVLLDEIFKFSKSYPSTLLKTVYTVAFDKNQPSVTAFEKKYQALQSQYPPARSSDGTQASVPKKFLRAYDEKVVFTITSLSQNTVQAVQNELKTFVDDASTKSRIDIQNALTDEQLERINFLQTIHCVRIVMNNDFITIEGLKNDVDVAVEKFKYIAILSN